MDSTTARCSGSKQSANQEEIAVKTNLGGLKATFQSMIDNLVALGPNLLAKKKPSFNTSSSSGTDFNTAIAPKGEVGAVITSFPRFSQLPLELRRKIWGYSLRSPRVVKIIFTIQSFDGGPTRYPRNNTWRAAGGHPAVILASRESRKVALETYQGIRGTEPRSPLVYFNSEQDILVFLLGVRGRDPADRGLCTNGYINLAYLSVTYSNWCNNWPTMVSDLVTMPKLKGFNKYQLGYIESGRSLQHMVFADRIEDVDHGLFRDQWSRIKGVIQELEIAFPRWKSTKVVVGGHLSW